MTDDEKPRESNEERIERIRRLVDESYVNIAKKKPRKPRKVRR